MKKEISNIGREMLEFQEQLAKDRCYAPIPPNMFDGDVRQKYKDALPGWCILSGCDDALHTFDGTVICSGYERVVIGDYGAFVEISPEKISEQMLRCQPGQEYRICDDRFKNNVKYHWLTAVDNSGIKVYYQQKTVDYADYKPGMFYVSPYEVEPVKHQTIDLSHIMRVDYDEILGPNLKLTKVLLYNGTKITEAEALRCAKSCEYSPYILSVSEKTWEHLFLNK